MNWQNFLLRQPGNFRKLLPSARGNVLVMPTRTIMPHTSSNVVSGPPRNRIAFAEKLAVGGFIFACIWATPVWIMTHMDCYRQLPDDVHMEGPFKG